MSRLFKKKKYKYLIYCQYFGTVTGTECIYNEDFTDYYEFACEITVATSDPIETGIIFYTEAEASKFCIENSTEDMEYYFVRK